MSSCSFVSQGKSLLELCDIELERCDGVPVQHVHVSREELLNRGKRLTQLVEQLAQVIASLGLDSVGPEKEGQALALLRHITMQHEVGQQGLQTHTVEAYRLSVSIDQAEISE